MVEISPLSRRLLRELCMGSRESIENLSKRLGVSRYIITQHMKVLENMLGLRYTVELNFDEMGFKTLRVIRIDFQKRPNPNDLEKIFERSKIVLFAATTNGNFGMIIFAATKTAREYTQWETSLSLSLAAYGAHIRSSDIAHMQLGFIPVTKEFIMESDVDDVYKRLLIQLNENARMSVKELSSRIGMKEDLTRYYLIKLNREKIIKRYTAIITKSPLNINIVYFLNYAVREGFEKRVDVERRTMYWKDLTEIPIVSEFQAMWSTSGSDMSFTWASYYDEKEGMKNSVNMDKEIYKKDSLVEMHAIIDSVVKGVMPIRSVDTKGTFDIVTWGSRVV